MSDNARPKKLRRGLSLCMIVKNEAETLEKCLELARPHVEEIVIVDTGSTDGTQEIAQRYADIYDEIEWPDSFAIARNHSLDLATYEYLLILDGDEYIPDPLHWKRIRKAIRRRDLAVVQLLLRNLLRNDQIVAAERIWHERIIWNSPQIRYFGKVHNQVQEAITHCIQRTGRKAIQVNAEVIHTGYALAQEKMRKKYSPRIHLLRAEYENPRDVVLKAYYGYQLGVALFVLQELDEAAEIFDAIQYEHMNATNAFYTRMLAAQTHIALRNPAKALLHCNALLTLNRTEPMGYYSTGLALIQSGKVGDGLLMLLEAIRLNEEASKSIRFILNPLILLKVLGSICTRAGLTDYGLAFTKMYEKKQYSAQLLRSMIESLKTGIVLAEREAA